MASRGGLRVALILALICVAACSRTMGCSACPGQQLAPIPGGFNPSAQIDRAVQVRLTDHGMSFVDKAFQNLLSSYARMSCGAAGDVPCPTGFTSPPGGASDPSSCDATRSVCIEQLSGKPGPLMGFQIQRTVSSGATICRDDPSLPGARPCYVWLRFESLNLASQAPNQLLINTSAQIRTNDIPVQYSIGGVNIDCVVHLDTSLVPTNVQPFTVNALLGSWTPPSGVGGRQLQISISSVDAQIPDSELQITEDPTNSNPLCLLANLGPIKAALIPQLTNRLGDVVRGKLDSALGWKCTGPAAEPCPAQTTCNASGLCQDMAGAIVPGKLGTEGRADFASLFSGGGTSREQADISFLVGGTSATDTTGVDVGVLAGAEAASWDPSCAMMLPSPRLRPGWTPPVALPPADAVDLDFDGTPETSFMLAAGLSNDLLSQLIWTAYTDGLFCQTISSNQIGLLNTGSLSLLIPSLSKLTHSDRYSWAIYPVMLTLRPLAEPAISVGSGRVDRSGMTPQLVDPLIDLFLKDFEVTFYAMIEERWVRLMTITLDLHFGMGAVATPNNALELVVGDLSRSTSNVRVTNSEILAENTTDLATATPSLIQLAASRLVGALPALTLPTGSALGGFELSVLGIRGVDDGSGSYSNVGLYMNLAFDPSLAPPLSLAAETEARIVSVRLPPIESFRAGHFGKLPEVDLALSGRAPSGSALEYQLRLDGGLWSPFFTPKSAIVTLSRSELLLEGRHQIEVRGRVVGAYRTLDPTPVTLDVVIDPEPPYLSAEMDERRSGLVIHAFDVVSLDRVRTEVAVDGVWRLVAPNADGFVPIPEVREPDRGIAVAAIDEQGNRAVLDLRAQVQKSPNQPSTRSDCTCVKLDETDPLMGRLSFVVVAAIALRWRAKERRRSRNQEHRKAD
jgi:hypothetical protein